MHDGSLQYAGDCGAQLDGGTGSPSRSTSSHVAAGSRPARAGAASTSGTVRPQHGHRLAVGNLQEVHPEHLTAAVCDPHAPAADAMPTRIGVTTRNRASRCWARVTKRLTAKAMPSSTRPNAMARANWPRLVARTAAVVSTRVSPWMFPPTICAAPTSLTTAPNPANAAASSGNWASASSARSAHARVAPSARICSRKFGSTCWRAAAVSADTIGVAISAWAMTMAVGVYSNPNAPNGPLRHSSTVTNNPTTTGGRPIPVLAAASNTRRPENRPRASAAPRVPRAATRRRWR